MGLLSLSFFGISACSFIGTVEGPNAQSSALGCRV